MMYPAPRPGSHAAQPDGSARASPLDAGSRPAGSIAATALTTVQPWGKGVSEHRPESALRSMIRIFIADDHAIVRAGLKAFVAGEKDMIVSGEASDGRDTLACLSEAGCDEQGAM
jgi:hypothetical protein